MSNSAMSAYGLGAPRRELSQLAENWFDQHRPQSDEEIEARRTEHRKVLDAPARSFATVLIWAEDLELRPTQAQWAAARAMPESTTLRQVLYALGAVREDLPA